MTYCYAQLLRIPFDAAATQTIAALEEEGFGVLTTIDIQDTRKLNAVQFGVIANSQ